MRSPLILAASLLLTVALAGPAGASGSVSPSWDPTSVNPGPFAGVALAGATDTHHYQNAPDGAVCIALAQPYTVFVQTSGPVAVSAGGQTSVIDGSGSLHFWRGVCTAFDISVANGGELPVAYAIEVVGGPAAQPGPIVCSGCNAILA